MEQKTLLITGFEPFQQETINPSWEAVALLPDTIGPWRLEKLRLPVVFGKAADLAIARAQQLCPQAILAVGQAGGRGAVTPELVAINTRDAAIPDNEGNAFQGQPVVPGGGDGYFATAPVRQMVQAVAAQGIPCKLSYTAGAYVCNDLFYRLLHQYRGTGVLVDFIHVPFLPEQAKNGEPSMALADMARALEALISLATRSPSPLRAEPRAVALPPGAAQRSRTTSPGSAGRQEAGVMALGSCR